MHNHYKDILDRIAEPPTWFDDDGVPRWGSFSPRSLGNIYVAEAALAEISCQACGMRFRVAMSESFVERRFGLDDAIRLRRVRYGDPPNVGCCPGGPTMSSEMHAILEYWCRDEIGMDWVRDPTFEGPIAGEELEPPDTLAAVLAAVVADKPPASDKGRDPAGPRTIVHVACTGPRNRYDLAGRLVSALSGGGDGRVLVIFPSGYVVVARKMLEGHVPDGDIGHGQEARRVTMASFDGLGSIRLSAYDSLMVLAGPSSTNIRSQASRDAAEARLAAAPFGGVVVELLLSRSHPLWPRPDVVVDAMGHAE